VSSADAVRASRTRAGVLAGRAPLAPHGAQSHNDPKQAHLYDYFYSKRLLLHGRDLRSKN